jgi:hypothetical protein
MGVISFGSACRPGSRHGRLLRRAGMVISGTRLGAALLTVGMTPAEASADKASTAVAPVAQLAQSATTNHPNDPFDSGCNNSAYISQRPLRRFGVTHVDGHGRRKTSPMSMCTLRLHRLPATMLLPILRLFSTGVLLMLSARE